MIEEHQEFMAKIKVLDTGGHVAFYLTGIPGTLIDGQLYLPPTIQLPTSAQRYYIKEIHCLIMDKILMSPWSMVVEPYQTVVLHTTVFDYEPKV